MRTLIILFVAVLSGVHLFWGRSYAQGEGTPDNDELSKSILEKADQVRFPNRGFEVSVTITSTGGNASPEPRKYRILSKGNDNTIIMATEPAEERGQILLMKGHDLWIFLPTVSQPVRLGLAQRLTGQVANGDLARANFSGDYQPSLIRTEKIGDQSMYVLELTAVDRSVTYHRVLYWVREADYWPQKAEFYSLSNRLLKTCLYEDSRPLGGRPRPTRLVMQDALRSGEESILSYADMRLRDLPDKVFTKDYLKRLE
jgi:outer membrane lipoprotein-sorting protein